MRKFILVLLLFSIFACSNNEARENNIPLVLVQKPVLSRGVNISNHSGQVKGKYESMLAFQTSGKIAVRNVKMGDSVKAGELLLSIDPVDITEALNIAKAQLDDTKSRLDLAETDHQRQATLFKEGAVSRARFDQSLTTLETARTGYQQAAARYKQQQNMLGYAELRAESDGIVTDILAEVGQVVAAGQPVLSFVRSGSFEVEIFVPESANTMHEGMTATVNFWAMPNEAVQAVISEVASSADPFTRTFKVRAELIEPPAWVKLGMTASVYIANPMGGADASYDVPSTAVYNSDGKAYVWVLAEDSVVHMREVDVEKYENTVVTVNHGLSVDDEIVVSGVHKLFEGQQVRK